MTRMDAGELYGCFVQRSQEATAVVGIRDEEKDEKSSC